jgi:hypothetical protein
VQRILPRLLRPAGLTPDPLDYSFAWCIMGTLCAIGALPAQAAYEEGAWGRKGLGEGLGFKGWKHSDKGKASHCRFLLEEECEARAGCCSLHPPTLLLTLTSPSHNHAHTHSNPFF